MAQIDTQGYLSLLRRLRAKWYGHIRNAKVCSPEQINAFEHDRNRLLPDDLRQFYLVLNGTPSRKGETSDELGFSFWSLETVATAPEIFGDCDELPVNQRNHIFVIADYLQCSWGYGIDLGETQMRGTVYLVGVPNTPIVAPSFSEFLSKYYVNDRALYPIAK